MENTITTLKIKINNKNIPDFKEYIRPIITEFIDVLEKNFSEDTTENFYKNIGSLKLTRNNHLPSNVAGIYDSIKNEIIYEEEEFEKEKPFTLFHELFHMASSVGENVGFHNGFSKCGFGINEGYTELLTRKYFGKEEEDSGYFIETAIASVLNNVIGEEKMKYLYMNANFYALLLELNKYLGDDTLTFIRKIDRYTNLTTTQLSFLFKIPIYDKYIASLVEEISKYLAKIYVKKNIDTVKDISPNDLTKYIKLFSEYDNLITEWQCKDSYLCNYQIDTSYLPWYINEINNKIAINGTKRK